MSANTVTLVVGVVGILGTVSGTLLTLRSEFKKLQGERVEQQRTRRAGVYADLVATLLQFDELISASTPDFERIRKWHIRYLELVGAVRILAGDKVVEPLRRMREVIGRIPFPEQATGVEEAISAYRAHSQDLGRANTELFEAMRAEVALNQRGGTH